MSLQSRFFALTYDRMSAKMERAGLHAHREALLAGASGRVLEIGAGTGANLDLYGSEVLSLTVTEPESPMLKRLQRRVKEQTPTAAVLRAPAEGSAFRGRQLRHRSLGPRALRSERPAERAARAAPGAAARAGSCCSSSTSARMSQASRESRTG